MPTPYCLKSHPPVMGIAVLLALLCLSCVSGAWAAPPQIYVIPKGSQHLFWKTVHAGARQAAEDLGARIYFRGPGEDDNRSGQAALIRRAIDQGYDGIVLAPNHDSKYVELVHEARDKGIAVVVIDSRLQGGFHQNFVATDNYLGGKRAGQAMVRALDGRGRVMLLRYLKDNASTERREQGFIDALEGSGVEIVAQDYVGASVGEAMRNSVAMLAGTGDLDGVFAPNESTTQGVLMALRSTNRLGSVRVVGFDYSPGALESLKRSELDALVLQQPYHIGYVGVQAAVAAISQHPLQREIWIDSVVVDRENLGDPEVQAIIEQSRLE